MPKTAGFVLVAGPLVQAHRLPGAGRLADRLEADSSLRRACPVRGRLFAFAFLERPLLCVRDHRALRCRAGLWTVLVSHHPCGHGKCRPPLRERGRRDLVDHARCRAELSMGIAALMLRSWWAAPDRSLRPCAPHEQHPDDLPDLRVAVRDRRGRLSGGPGRRRPKETGQAAAAERPLGLASTITQRGPTTSTGRSSHVQQGGPGPVLDGRPLLVTAGL